MVRQVISQDLEKIIKDAGLKIKALLLRELKRVQLPLLEVGVYNKKYQQEGIPTGGNHWQGDWEVAPSKGIAEEKQGQILNPDDAHCVRGYLILTPEGIFQMEEEPFFDNPKKKYTSDLPSWNTRKEVPQHYVTYAQYALNVIEYLKAPKEQQASAHSDF